MAGCFRRMGFVLVMLVLGGGCSPPDGLQDGIYRDGEAGFSLEVAEGWSEVDLAEAIGSPMARRMADRIGGSLFLTPGDPAQTLMTVFAGPGGRRSFELMSGSQLAGLYRNAGMTVEREEFVELEDFPGYRLEGGFPDGRSLRILLFPCGEKLVTLQVHSRQPLDEDLIDDIEGMIRSIRAL